MRWIIILVFFLTGCAYMSAEELLAVAMECGTEPVCDEHWTAWNEREELIERRRLRKEAEKGPDCGDGIAVHDVTRDSWSCVGDINQIFW